MKNLRSALFGCAMLCIAGAGCTPSAVQTTHDIGGVVNAVAAGGAQLAPLVCEVVASGTACGPDAQAVAAVAAIVGQILANWPASRAPAISGPPKVIAINGVAVTLPPEQAAEVLRVMGRQ